MATTIRPIDNLGSAIASIVERTGGQRRSTVDHDELPFRISGSPVNKLPPQAIAVATANASA
jgi:hypothetical protein